jgi:hypothetical protein
MSQPTLFELAYWYDAEIGRLQRTSAPQWLIGLFEAERETVDTAIRNRREQRTSRTKRRLTIDHARALIEQGDAWTPGTVTDEFDAVWGVLSYPGLMTVDHVLIRHADDYNDWMSLVK